MSGSVNSVTIIGNLGRDVEVRSTGSGRVANLAVATSESWQDKSSGERKESVQWHRVTIFDEKLVEVAEKYLRKGSKVYLRGQLQTRKYTDNAGQERHVTEVVLQRFRGELVMLDDAPRSDRAEQPRQEVQAPAPRAAARPTYGNDIDDSIPF